MAKIGVTPAIIFGRHWASEFKPVRDQVLKCAKYYPNHSAIEEDGNIMTYNELLQDSLSIATWLRQNADFKKNVEEKLVAVVGNRSSAIVTALLSTWRAGLAYLPVSSDYPFERIEYLLSDAKPLAILVDKSTTPDALLEKLRDYPGVAYIEDILKGESPDADACDIDKIIEPESAAYVIYTSGSTGKPKGAILTHRNVANFVIAHLSDIGLTNLDRQGWSGNVSFDASVSDIWPTLAEGATLCIAPPKIHNNLHILLSWLKEAEITGTLLPTALVNMLFGNENHWWEGLSLRFLLTGGDRLTRRPPNNLPFRIINAYGPTECTVWTTLQQPSSVPFRGDAKAPGIGQPIANTFVAILDEKLRPCMINQQGELCIGGAGVGRGYLGKPELTQERFIEDYYGSFSGTSKLYRTGDQAILKKDGMIQFVGRSDRQIALKGFRIEAGEVESALMNHGNVKEALVKRYDYPSLGPQLIAFVTMKNAANEPSFMQEIRSVMKQAVPDYMVPQQFICLEAMPLTPNGKIDENSLIPPVRKRKQLVQSGLLSNELMQPKSDIENKICDIFAEVLTIDRVGVTDDFFALGGESITGMSAMSKIEEVFGQELQSDTMQIYPTARKIASFLSGEIKSGHQQKTNWQQECDIDLKPQPYRAVREDAAILVTGGHGFTGSATLEVLLRQNVKTRVTALVRNQQSALQLQEKFHHVGKRLKVIIGDLSKPLLGLTQEKWQDLVDDTRAIIHAGALVDHYKNYEALRAPNVDGTTTLAELALLAGGGSVPLIYTSTISVSDDMDGQTENGYARSKWVSEKRLEKAAQLGLPVKVVRLGRMMPARQHGLFNPNDTLFILFSACVLLGKSPHWAFWEAAVPVDIAANALMLGDDVKSAFNIGFIPLKPWSSKAFIEALSALKPMQFIPFESWCAELKKSSSSMARKALTLIDINQDMAFTTDNQDELNKALSTMQPMLDSHWSGFTSADYRTMAAELLAQLNNL